MKNNSLLSVGDRRYIEAHTVVYQRLAEGTRLWFPTDQKFFHPCGLATVPDTFGLRAGQYVMYGCSDYWGIIATERFYSGAGFLFETRLSSCGAGLPLRREVRNNLLGESGVPLGKGSSQIIEYCFFYIELFGSPTHL